MQFREALRAAMSEEMRRNPDVFLIGEEVAEYNGAYKVSEGMLKEFGPSRIVDAPISECGFAGLGGKRLRSSAVILRIVSEPSLSWRSTSSSFATRRSAARSA